MNINVVHVQNITKHYEIWQKISDQPKKICPNCSGQLQKLISMSSFQLKGGGWHSDGYSSIKSNDGKGIGDNNDSIEKKATTKEALPGSQPSQSQLMA